MAKLLDLNVLREQTMEIKLLDGSELRLKKPTQKLYLQFIAMEKDLKDADIAEQMEGIKALALAVLNNNTAGKVFEDLEEEYDLAIQEAIITAYGEFIAEIMSRKN